MGVAVVTYPRILAAAAIEGMQNALGVLRQRCQIATPDRITLGAATGHPAALLVRIAVTVCSDWRKRHLTGTS